MTEKNSKNRSRTPDESESTSLAVPTYDPFQALMSPFDGFFESFFPSSMKSFVTELGTRQPDIDLQDRGDHFVLTAELPGFDKKDTEVRVNPDSLELKAERRSESSKDGGSQSSFASFHRYFSLPETVLPDKVDGTMKNGVLSLKLPKAEPKPEGKPKRVALK